MKDTLETINLAEVCYLLEAGNSLSDVKLVMGQMGAEELVFTLCGENIEIDRKLFLGNRKTAFSKIPAALESIQNVMWQKEEAAL